jgi:hydroxymethylpyrimidine/phosphomethylpyrimidine kinase
VFSDLEVGAVKIGMLSQPAVIEAVTSGLNATTNARSCSIR